MELKHTKGPWRLDRDGWKGQYIYGNDERVKNKERFIAEVSLFYDGAEANARLISCAPEMLEALISDIKSAIDRADFSHAILGVESYVKYFGKTKKMKIIERATGLTIEEVLS